MPPPPSIRRCPAAGDGQVLRAKLGAEALHQQDPAGLIGIDGDAGTAVDRDVGA